MRAHTRKSGLNCGPTYKECQANNANRSVDSGVVPKQAQKTRKGRARK
jgi:hypothetical protein